jgi:hypothetical protein
MRNRVSKKTFEEPRPSKFDTQRERDNEDEEEEDNDKDPHFSDKDGGKKLGTHSGMFGSASKSGGQGYKTT